MPAKNPSPDKKEPYRKEWTLIGPALAKDLLAALHPDQRHHRDARVEQYASDMRQGAWRDDTEDAILLDWNGHLIDGQNRLRALIESGRSIHFWLVHGVDPAIMTVKDTGAARTIADSLRISGRGGEFSGRDLLVVGSIARRQLHWEAGRYTIASQKMTAQATHAEIGALLDTQPDIPNAAKMGIDAAKATRPTLVSASTYGFFWLNACRIDSDMAYRYQALWITPSDIPASSPIGLVRERFYRSKLAQSSKYYGKTRSDVLTSDEQLALLIRAWNLFLADMPATPARMQISRGKLRNENFPVFLTRELAVRAAKAEERGDR